MNPQINEYLAECRQRIADLRARSDYIPLSCSILRLEGIGGTALFNQPFSRIMPNRSYLEHVAGSFTETFAKAFISLSDSIDRDRIAAALSSVEAITGEIYPVLRKLPKPVQEHLRLPEGNDWWRIVFHLAWHFPRPFLKVSRRRLLSSNGVPAGMCDETFVQLYGMGGRTDLLPGLIFSALEHDLCICSEAAINAILEVLERYTQVCALELSEARALSADQRRVFDHLRAEFENGARMPVDVECTLLKLASSFESPPVTEWPGLMVGGCVERFLTLSKLNDQQEIAQIRGGAAEWFCQVADRAGNALPHWICDRPILFDDPRRGLRGPHPVLRRDARERWIGFVLATLKQHAPESIRIIWSTEMGPLSCGFAKLDRNMCAASVLAIDLVAMTTAAEEAAIRKRAACSPFMVQSMEEMGLRWATEAPPLTPKSCTLGQVVESLRRFGEEYWRVEDQIREETPLNAKHFRTQLGADVSEARAYLLAVPDFTVLRAWTQSEWKEEFTFVTGRRIVDTLIERSSGSLHKNAIESLSLAETVALLNTAVEEWDKALPDRLRQEYAAEQARLRSAQLASKRDGRLYVEDVDSFSKVRNADRTAVAGYLKNGYLDVGEEAIQVALESILDVAFHKKDWGGEVNDLYTANVLVRGVRMPTAFMLKGNGQKARTMEIAHCGKNGDQVIRLFRSAASLFVIQFVGNISEAVIHQAKSEVASLRSVGHEAYFLILDGQDTARLMHAYEKL